MTRQFRTSQRIQAVQDPIIPIIAKQIKQCPGTISLAQGIVNFTPPESVFSDIANPLAYPALQAYGPVSGNADLKDQIRRKLSSDNRIKPEKYEIMVTAGANMGFLNAMLAICDPGDEVILLSPYYFNHHMAVELVNATVKVVATDSHFLPDIDRIKSAINGKTRAIVTVSPNNPTGAVYSKELLQSINSLCRDNGLYHISDEAYEYFVYEDATHYSPASIEDAQEHTISLFSLSKSYGLAGWRIGYMVFPIHLLEALEKIQDTNLICTTQAAQLLAVNTLKLGSEYCRKYINTLNTNRNTCINILKNIQSGIQYYNPTGAFYIFLKFSSQLSDIEVAKYLIQQHQVAVLPGNTFGITDQCSIRVSYGAQNIEQLTEAMERLHSGLSQIIS